MAGFITYVNVKYMITIGKGRGLKGFILLQGAYILYEMLQY